LKVLLDKILKLEYLGLFMMRENLKKKNNIYDAIANNIDVIVSKSAST